MPRLPTCLAALAALLGAAALGAAPTGAQAQSAWYARLWSVDGATMLAVRANTGQEVRGGRRGMRHGRRVPLVIDDEDTVHFDVSSGAQYATRWVLHRDGAVVRVQQWVRRGPEGVAFELVRQVAVASDGSGPEAAGSRPSP